MNVCMSVCVCLSVHMSMCIRMCERSVVACDVPAPQWNFSFWIYISIWKCKCKSIGFETYTSICIRTAHTFKCNSIQFHPIQFNSILRNYFRIFLFKEFDNQSIEREWEGGSFNGHNVRNYRIARNYRKVSFDWYFIDGTCFTHLHSISKYIFLFREKWAFRLKNNISLIVDGNTFFFLLSSIGISFWSKCVHFIPRDERIQIKFWLIYSMLSRMNCFYFYRSHKKNVESKMNGRKRESEREGQRAKAKRIERECEICQLNHFDLYALSRLSIRFTTL